MDKREIKFRVWDGDAMYDATDYPDWTLDSFVNAPRLKPECRPDMERYKLMQYTGLKDKNGREIYEGDVVLHHEEEGDENHEAWRGGTAFVTAIPFGFKFKEIDCGEWRFYGPDADEWRDYLLEVIGNVYENPELLDGK